MVDSCSRRLLRSAKWRKQPATTSQIAFVKRRYSKRIATAKDFDLNEANDGSQYLNNTGEGDDKIFDLDDRADEVMNYDYDYDDAENVYDDTDNVDLEITKTADEVYLYKKACGDHQMFFLI